MGAIPSPQNWSKDPYTRIGGRFDALEKETERQNTQAGPPTSDSFNADATSINIPNLYNTKVLSQIVTIPPGRTKVTVQVQVAAGVTKTGTANGDTLGVAVQARVGSVIGYTGKGRLTLNAGQVDQAFANSFLSATVNGSGGTNVEVSVWAYWAGSAGAYTGYDEAHMTGSLVYT